MTPLLPVMTDFEVHSGYCTQLLEELLSKPEATPSHIQCLVLGITRQPFNTSNIELSTLLRKSAKDPVLLEKMLVMGTRVTDANLPDAVAFLSDGDEAILDILLTQGVHSQIDQHVLDATCRAARTAKKPRLASCLREHGAIPDVPKGRCYCFYVINRWCRVYLTRT